MDFNVHNEYGKLKKVLIASLTYSRNNGAGVNVAEAKRRQEIIKGQSSLIQLFKKHGIQADAINTERLFGASVGFARDPFVVIGDKVIVHQHNNGKMDRQAEKALLQVFGLKDISNVIYMEGRDGVRLDGGDVILRNDTIYVGQNGEKTNGLGLALVDKHFGNDFRVVPMNMLEDDSGRPILHLDCVLNLLSENEALVFPKGLSRRAQNEVFNNFDATEITGDEQRHLGANVLNLGDRHIVSQPKHERINRALVDKGFQVSLVDFGNTSSSRGALRCAVCPLVRERE